MTAPAAGAMVGLAIGLGAVLLGSWVRARRPLRLRDRIGPYVQVPGLATARPHDRTVAWRDVRVLLAGRASEGSDRDLVRRLLRAGRPQSPAQYRLERVIWGAAVGVVGLLAGSALGGAQSPVIVGLLTLLAAVVGWGACDARLRGQARRRGQAIERQLPALADLVALAVAAGATPVVALERAAATVPGPLSDDVTLTVREVHSGTAVDLALRDLAAISGVPSVGRFVDALLVALQRGTPLADVVRAQAADVRADERRRLMETAGRKDVTMLVPIVFLVLPTVVVIALFPGVQALHLVVP